MRSLAEAISEEQQRVRELIIRYDAIPTGALAALMMRMSLQRAEYAVASGDVVAMLKAHDDLQAYKS